MEIVIAECSAILLWPFCDRVPIADTPARSDHAPIADTPARASVSTNVICQSRGGDPAAAAGPGPGLIMMLRSQEPALDQNFPSQINLKPIRVTAGASDTAAAVTVDPGPAPHDGPARLPSAAVTVTVTASALRLAVAGTVPRLRRPFRY